jgi:2-oxoisovalerate dehydrogenase E1 component alpha subunit
MTSSTPSTTLIRDLYTRMLLTRIVDNCAWRMHIEERIDFVASCRGHEAAQVGSAVCIEVGKDFTLPYYRDLGVVLTVGMTPYEVFRTYLQTHSPPAIAGAPPALLEHHLEKPRAMLHWGYHKHNTITGPTPTATQILHAAGIAFASKLRKASVVTIAYCSDGVTAEADFVEGIQFAAQHQLPVVFVCEQDCSQSAPSLSLVPSCFSNRTLPTGLRHQRVCGINVVDVYQAMQAATQHARQGLGPVLLEICVSRFPPTLQAKQATELADIEGAEAHDPLVHCRRLLQEQGAWDDEWASQLYTRLSTEVERAMIDAIHDTSR